MLSSKVRSTFLDFFVEKEHTAVHSSSLVPANDPTLLFANAGMVQFKDVFTGQEKRNYQRATSSQRCVRAGGKHNDLDEVGKTARHHTFFEMLGNFSFGDYFKQDAIGWAWQLLTSRLGLDPDKLIVSIFQGDEEMKLNEDTQAKEIWQEVSGLAPKRILSLPKSENFWMMGDVGPMGPCSEIHYYVGDGKPPVPNADPNDPQWSQWLEIWNLVFMQYERREAGGELHPLPAPSIDTGAGLERLTAVLQGKKSNYDTDLFQPLLQFIAKTAGKTYGEDPQNDISMRVIADHARTVAFLIADGVFPDKSGREYVLRRIFRRAVRHGKQLEITEPFLHCVCQKVVEEMSKAYPELEERSSVIEEVALEEEKRFRATLDRGLSLLEDEFQLCEKAQEKTLDGKTVFQLYDTFGFPDDLTEIIATERGFSIDKQGFKKEMEQARKRSRFAGSDETAVSAIFKELSNEIPETKFVGYGETTGQAEVVTLLKEGAQVREVSSGSFLLISDTTPFYAESGGQAGDTGTIETEHGVARVIDTQKPTGSYFVHHCELESGRFRAGDSIRLQVNQTRRRKIRANHSATHLLHHSLRQILGDHVAQKGSLVTADRLRFDFSHFNPVTDDEKLRIEQAVNEKIRENKTSTTEVLAMEEAKKKGAIAMFGEKYGEKVRVVQIGSESIEFCGGTHVNQTGDIGIFKIVNESGIAQGVRRIEALTAERALGHFQELEEKLTQTGALLRVASPEVPARVRKLQEQLKESEKEITTLKTKLASGGSTDLFAQVREVNGVSVLITQTEVADAKALRQTGDQLRDKIGSGVLFLAGTDENKMMFLAMVTKDQTDRFHAGKMVSLAADVVGGRGGGRPDMAQGGASDPSRVDQVLAAAEKYVLEA